MSEARGEQPSSPVLHACAPLTRADYRAALAVGLCFFCLYGYTLAPTVTGEDSGELIGAAYSLGIPHPPGYPVWTLLGHLFTWIPFGSIAWRVNLLSAACGATTLALLVLVGITMTGHRRAAIAGAALLGLSRVFWEQALIAEVYTLNTAWMAGLLLLGLRGMHRIGGVCLFALLAGIGTGVHNTLVLLAPFWAVLAWYQMPPAMRHAPGTFIKAALLFLLGTCVYAYLPLASHFDPAVDWGDPETLSRWWDVVRRDQFAFMVDQYPRSLPRFAGQMAIISLFWLRDLLLIGALLGIWGGWLLYRRNRLLGAWLAATAMVTVIAPVLMQNFEQSREWHWVMRVFLLPAELITALGIVCALAWGGAAWPRMRAFLTGLVVATILASFSLHSVQSRRNYYYAEDYGRNILASLPPDSIYVPGGDHQAFPVLYLQVVEGLRPDVTLLRKYGYLDLLALPGLAEANPDRWGLFPPRRFDPEIYGWVLKHTDRPLVFSQESAIHESPATYAPLGLLVQALRPGEATAASLPLSSLTWRNPLPEHPVREYSLSLIQYDVALARARMAFAEGDRSGALARLAEAAELGHQEPEILNNIGVLCARNGALDAAREYFEAVLKAYPEHVAAQRNLERVKRKLE